MDVLAPANRRYLRRDRAGGGWCYSEGNDVKKSIKDAGPAFPTQHVSQGNTVPGMTLRDYFAAQALPALVTSAFECNHDKWDATAQHAYLIADAMLKAREATP